jgi:lauroyl/myristoyl acyltransferase
VTVRLSSPPPSSAPPSSRSSALPPARDFVRPDAYLLRAFAVWGAARAPKPFIRYVPVAAALLFTVALPSVRRMVRRNLRRLRGPRSLFEEQRDMVKTFVHFAACLTEGLTIASNRSCEVESTVEGVEHLERELGRGRGVVCVTAHTGAWEISGPLLRRALGIDVVIAMGKEANVRSRILQDSLRARSGVRVVHVDDDRFAALDLLQHLRRGALVGLQLDRLSPGMRGIEVEFLDGKAEVPSGPFELAKRSGAAIVPIFTRRIGYFRYAVEVSPAIHLARQASAAELAAAAQACASAMGLFLRNHPTHWFHFVSDEQEGHRDGKEKTAG